MSWIHKQTWLLFSDNFRPWERICKQEAVYCDENRTQDLFSISPQTNGLVERFNQTLQHSLVKVVNENQYGLCAHVYSTFHFQTGSSLCSA